MGRFELTQKPDVVFKKQADVVDPVFKHGDPFDSHSQGIAGVNPAVDAAQIEDIRVYHPATENLYPPGMFADIASVPTADMARDIHLGARFGEREIRRPQADLRIGPKHFFGEEEQHLFQVGK